jgi:hypothetical protein
MHTGAKYQKITNSVSLPMEEVILFMLHVKLKIKFTFINCEKFIRNRKLKYPVRLLVLSYGEKEKACLRFL